MFGIGWTEMLVLGVVALIVIGPKDLPVVMSRLGKMVNSVRRMGSEFQRELNKASGLDQITDLRRSITAPLKQTADEIRKEFNKPTASGGFEPSGIVKPKDPSAESVVDEIHEKIGVPVKQPYVPFTKDAQDKYRKEQMAEAVTKAVAEKSAATAPVESPAPPEATPPPAKKPRAPRKPKAETTDQPELVLETPAPAKKPRKPRAAKPKSEA
jgi:sec-independent protein translocase protein TatB